MALLERGITPMLEHLLTVAKVVILEGGRAVGKTTLAHTVADRHQFRTRFDLSNPDDRQLLSVDPHRILAASPTPIFIDEAQLEPELTVAIKRLVDRNQEPGQVLLTGSSRIGRGALGGSDPLAGRSVRLRLSSLTQSELAGHPHNTIDTWWTEEPSETIYPELHLLDLFQRFATGGLPSIALTETGHPRTNLDDVRRLLNSYVQGVITLNLAGTRTDSQALERTFRYLAANPGQILNANRAASELGLTTKSIRAYLDLCSSSFLLDIAPAHRPTQHQTVTAHPRVFASDTGLAVWAAETTPARILRDPRLTGSLLENLVAQEVIAQSAWSRKPASTLHWRDTRTNTEVDLVLRRDDGGLLAIEVKSAATIKSNDTKGLRAFAQAAGDRFVRGIIVHTGRAVTQVDHNIWAVPVSSLFNNFDGDKQ